MTALITRFLPSLIPGLGMFANPWIWIVLAALVTTGFAAGVKVEGWHRDSGDLASTEAWANAYVAKVEQFRTSAGFATAALEMQRQKSATDEATWKERVKNEKHPLGTCTPAAAGHAAAAATVLFTPEFVGLLNGAWQVGLPATGHPAGPHGDPSGTDPVTPERVLGNVEDNAKLCNGFREVILQWQALARRNGWAK